MPIHASWHTWWNPKTLNPSTTTRRTRWWKRRKNLMNSERGPMIMPVTARCSPNEPCGIRGRHCVNALSRAGEGLYGGEGLLLRPDRARESATDAFNDDKLDPLFIKAVDAP